MKLEINLRIMDAFKVEEIAKEESHTKIILDKDDVASLLPLPDDSSYYVKKLKPKEFD